MPRRGDPSGKAKPDFPNEPTVDPNPKKPSHLLT